MKIGFIRLVSWFLVGGLLIGLSTFQAFSQHKSDRIEGELIVQMDRQKGPVALEKAFSTFQGKSTDFRLERTLSSRMDIYLYSFDETVIDGPSLLGAVRRHPHVVLAQFNHKVELRAQNIPNDPSFTSQWNMNNTGQTGGTVDADVDGPEAWDITTGGLTAQGDTIVVAVIDGGVDLDHEDLNFWKNRHETPGDGLDNDNNGYIDDYDGWDAYNSDGSIPSSDHGTHVSGIVGAIGNNSTGVVGVNWDVQIMPVAGSSGNEATVVEAYGYVVELRATYNETNGDSGAFVVATNSSFGVDFGDPASYPIWCSMYDTLGQKGILNAAATMNRDEDVDQVGDVPTACASPYMIAVTNTTDDDQRNSSAAYGNQTIDLGAPGTSIYSTENGDTYGNKTGTSMASPHVAGAVALLYSGACSSLIQAYKQDPDSMALVIRDILFNAVDPLPDLQGKTTTGGRLNLHQGVQGVVGPTARFGFDSTGILYQFTDSSINNTGLIWQFGDGDTSHQPDPEHIYADTGTYEVCLTAENDCQNDTTCDTVEVRCQQPTQAGFSYQSDSTSYNVNFADQSDNGFDFWWDFGDGNTDTLRNPVHTYGDTGTYQVEMITSSVCGSDTITKMITVNCIVPEAGFNKSVSGSVVSFYSERNFEGTYSWDFGDGKTGSGQSPTHTYSSGGMYTVCLTITNDCGVDSSCEPVVISGVPGQEDKQSEIRVLPNPNEGKFAIQLTQPQREAYRVMVYNTIGQQVYHRTVPAHQTTTQVDLTNQKAEGLYFINMVTEQRTYTKKVLVR